jgi:uncharacterized protein YggE
MRKKLWLVLSIGLMLTVIGLAGCNTTSPANATFTGGIFSSQSTGIWVSGEGKVTAVPDTTILSLGVQVQATTVSQAQGQASSSMNAVVNALKAGGVAEKDIQTTNYNIQQLTRYDEATRQQIVIGYLVTNTVSAKIRKVENTGSIIDTTAAAGGDYIHINSISFTIDDPKTYVTQARQMAMADAKSKAQQLADQSGVKLGEPTYIVEIGGSVPIKSTPGTGVPSVPDASPSPISPGEMNITLTVQVAYNIK